MLVRHVRYSVRYEVRSTIKGFQIRCPRNYSTTFATPISSSARQRSLSRASHPLSPKWHLHTQIRYAKKKVTVNLDDLPQGAVQIEATKLPPQDHEPDYPPLLQQVRNNMLKFSHCVLLTRVGGFYEVRTWKCRVEGLD